VKYFLLQKNNECYVASESQASIQIKPALRMLQNPS